MKRIQFLNNLVCEMYRRIVGKGLLSIVLTLCLGSVCNAAVEFDIVYDDRKKKKNSRKFKKMEIY